MANIEKAENGKAGKIQTNVWLPESVYKYLRRAAFEANISQSAFVENLLIAEMAKESK